MVFIPQRTALLVRHLAALILLLPVIALPLMRLIGYPPDVYSAIGLILLVAGLVALPAVITRLYLLATMRYTLLPEGALEIRFGTRYERLPVEAVEEICSGGSIPAVLRENAPGWWYSWSGRVSFPEIEKPVDWLATSHGSNLLLVLLKDRMLAISPLDPAGFLRAFSECASQGVMERMDPISIEPPPLFMDIFDHSAAASLLGAGLVAVTGLGAFILGLQPSLPASMPFKFSVAGTPIAPGSPIRLIILPIMGGLVWLLNGVLGWLGWRRNDRVAAYIMWGTAFLVGIGLWFATFVLVLNK
jgi:hypothetical protein